MTFITNYFLNGVPIVHADGLITSELGTYKRVRLPILKIWGDEQCDGYISKLEQKIVLVDNKLAFVWAGNRTKAKAVFEYLQKNLQNITSENFFEVNEFKSLINKEVSFILVINNFKGIEGKAYFYHHNIMDHDVSTFGKVFISGSGWGDFLNHLFMMSRHMDNLGSKYEDAIGVAETVGASLFLFHFLWGHGLENSWGGVVETMYMSDKGFTKLDDTLFVFWTINLESKESYTFGFDQAFIKVKYLNDVLSYRVFINSENRDDVTYVKSFLSDQSEDYLNRAHELNFELSNRVINVVKIINNGNIENMLLRPMSGGKFFKNFEIKMAGSNLLQFKFTSELFISLLQDLDLSIPSTIEAINGSILENNVTCLTKLCE